MNFVDVSVILPMYNAEKWLDECLSSIINQKFCGKLELSIYNDASIDKSQEILNSWMERFKNANIKVITSGKNSGPPKGVGYAKNRAVEQSHGEYLCFLDAIIGSKFHRFPVGSTERYSKWANNLTKEQLYTQIYTSHGPTLVMPTWFCSREVFERVGGFKETGKGTPEDLLFYFEHLKLKGILFRIDEDLLMYRYHPEATTFSIDEKTIWSIRINELERNVLCQWQQLTIWNAGKQGRRFYRSLNTHNKHKVIAFCDVDEKKIKKGVYIYEESKELQKPTVPIIHFTQAKPPFIICVKLDLTGGKFEENLSRLNLIEGSDYYLFS